MKDNSDDQINILETKLKKSLNELIGKGDEISLLKKSNKNQIDENFKLKNDLTHSGIFLKEIDKIIFKLETKIEYLEENSKRFKQESNTLKQEKKKIEKEVKQLKSSLFSSSLKPFNSLKSLSSPEIAPKSNQLESSATLSFAQPQHP